MTPKTFTSVEFADAIVRLIRAEIEIDAQERAGIDVHQSYRDEAGMAKRDVTDAIRFHSADAGTFGSKIFGDPQK